MYLKNVNVIVSPCLTLKHIIVLTEYCTNNKPANKLQNLCNI